MKQFKEEFVQAINTKLGISCGLRESKVVLNLDERYFSTKLRFIYQKDHKSLVFADSNRSVIKGYLSPGAYRNLSDIAKSYVASHQENPDLFPEAHKAGQGKVVINNIPYEVLFIWQKHINYPRMEMEKIVPKQWEQVLRKWDLLINRHRTAFPKKLEGLYNQILAGDVEAFREVTDTYYDSFSFLQVNFAIGSLKLKSEFEFLKEFDPPEPSLFEVSKIIGDLTPKHLFSTGPWLAYDVEKYGWGNPASDLSTAVRFYLKRDFAKAGEFFEYLNQRYNNPELLKNIYLELIGDEARILIYPHLDPHPQRSREILKKAVDFYPLVARYFS